MEAMGDLKVWGGFDGRGLVILSDRPVEFQPTNKTSNVVMVDSLDDAVRYVNVATQTIGVYPYERKAQLRDRLASPGRSGCAASGPRTRTCWAARTTRCIHCSDS